MVRNRSRSEGGGRLLETEEISFTRLVEALAERHQTEGRQADQPVRPDEFTCARCHLVQHAARRADPDRSLCVDCAPRTAATR